MIDGWDETMAWLRADPEAVRAELLRAFEATADFAYSDWRPASLGMTADGATIVSITDMVRLEYEGLDDSFATDKWIEFTARYSLVKELAAERSKQNSANASKPRPSRQDPLKDKALPHISRLLNAHPTWKSGDIASEVRRLLKEGGAEGVDSLKPDTLSRWICEKRKKSDVAPLRHKT